MIPRATDMDAAAAEPPLNIFVNYRRSDSAGHAGRLQDALNREFGKDHVFYDVTDIEGGIDFAAAVRQAIERASIVLVVIGPRWKHRRASVVCWADAAARRFPASAR